MFKFSTDSLNDYVFSPPTNSIILEKVVDPTSSFEFIVPTTPTQKQLYSIQNPPLLHYGTDNESEYEYEIDNETFTENESNYDLPSMNQYPRKKNSSVITEPPKLPFITNIYVASLTVVGLFLLFRMIQK
jgi:hypothetical protein